MNETILHLSLLAAAYLIGSIPSSRRMLLSFVKGFGAVILSHPRVVDQWISALALPYFEPSFSWMWLSLLVAMIGHWNSPWHKLSARRGLWMALGASLAVSPLSLIGAVLFGALAYVTHPFKREIQERDRVSVSYVKISVIFGLLIAHWVLVGIEPMVWPGLGVIFILLWRHEGDLDRILESRAVES